MVRTFPAGGCIIGSVVIRMDQVKTGKLIARLRRRAGLTREALGESLGVTNKTVSRWENGHYMPGPEILALLAGKFRVSADELLAGELRDGKSPAEEAGGRKTDGNPPAASGTDAFSLPERKRYFIKKWRREHRAFLAALLLLPAAAVVLPLVFGRPLLAGLAPLIALLAYGYQNNRMMIWVESRLYDE